MGAADFNSWRYSVNSITDAGGRCLGWTDAAGNMLNRVGGGVNAAGGHVNTFQYADPRLGNPKMQVPTAAVAASQAADSVVATSPLASLPAGKFHAEVDITVYRPETTRLLHRLAFDIKGTAPDGLKVSVVDNNGEVVSGPVAADGTFRLTGRQFFDIKGRITADSRLKIDDLYTAKRYSYSFDTPVHVRDLPAAVMTMVTPTTQAKARRDDAKRREDGRVAVLLEAFRHGNLVITRERWVRELIARHPQWIDPTSRSYRPEIAEHFVK